jgi:glycosyltransferase involved in cell wall biosynthesis
MRILQIITSMLTGGAEHLVVDVTRILREKGHDVDVCVFSGERTDFFEELEKTGCKIFVLSGGQNFYSLRFIPQLRRIMRRYDVIHTHNSSPQLFAAIANMGLNRRLITTEHNTDNRKRDSWLLSRIDRWMYKRYDKIITISQQAEDNLRAYLGKTGQHPALARVETIFNGVDVARIHDAGPYRDGELRDETGRPVRIVGQVNLIQVAAFRPQKDQKTLMDALGLLPENYVVWLVGDGELHNQLHRYAASLPWSGRIRFFGNRRDVPRLLQTATIVCMSTHYEGLSLSNVEGMSAGKPFVASDVEGVHEVTQGAGVLVAEGDASGFAAAFRQLHTDPTYYHDVATRCYQRAQQFDITRMVEEYEKVYDRIVKYEA